MFKNETDKKTLNNNPDSAINKFLRFQQKICLHAR